MSATRNSRRKFTISFPEELAQKVDFLAQSESRTTSELFREAFRAYYARNMRTRMAEAREAGNFNPAGYTREDTERLIEEARREMKAQRK
jgi:metal-responsive CopG/Arc/MetJ family transcriptional regulator